MSTITRSLAAGLSAEEKRALLAQALRQKASQSQTFPLSFAQQRLWFIDQLEGSSPFYNIPVALRLNGRLNVENLRRTLDEIIRRHEALRTTFQTLKGQPAQVIAPPTPLTLLVHDLSHLPQSERLAQAQRLATEQSRQPFDLAADTLLRASLYRLDEQQHVLLLVMHHIISDGWSMGVLVRELTVLYEAFSTRSPSPLPELSIQYADFAHWQREWLQGEVLESQLAYWKQQLTGMSALQLPTDRVRSPGRAFRGGRHTLTISKTLRESLESLCREEEVTLFMLLLAAFKVLLSRYTGQEDIVVGTPIANRNHREVEQLIGFFVNSLVLRTDLAGEQSFRQLLRRVREVTLEAYAHQDLPFEKLVEELQPERDLSHNPLFQVMFALQNIPIPTLELSGLTVTNLQVDDQSALFDLTFSLWEGAEIITGSLDYNRDLFAAQTIERMLRHYQHLLAEAVANPDQPIASLSLLSDAERRQLVFAWNRTGSVYPREKAIHQLFEAQVARTPTAVAVKYDAEQLSYSELNARANQLAHHLRGLGVGPDMLVGLFVQRSAEMLIGMLGILKAGGAYVPLDPSYPQERLEFMVRDAGATVLVSQRALLGALPSVQSRIVCLDADEADLRGQSIENPSVGATGENLAYVIYTSGSTGQPKGISIPHRAVNRLVLNSDYVRLQATDRVAQASNASFDAATFEIWGALLNGACVVGITTDVALSPQTFAAQIKEQGISALFLTTALFNQLAREVSNAFSSVHHLLFGGEAVDPRWVSEVLRAGGPQRLLHVYGPTESTTFASWYPINEVAAGSTTIPIGRPIANTQIYVLDRQFQPVPVGVPGELHIGGDGLARNYWMRPALTAEKFVPNPFSEEAGARLYKTGDMVRYLPDGSVEFIGRVDHQVKLRGFRVEMGEIEAFLLEHAAVREAVVVVREDAPGDKRLVAYIVLQAGEEINAGSLRNYLKQRLPVYMVPSVFEIMESLPLTPNGKVNRQALPAPNRMRAELEETYVAPQTPVQEVVAGMWADLLKLERVGIEDNFFELGGHSLMATQFVSRARETFRVELPLRNLFEAPTVAGIAQCIEAAQAAESALEAAPISRITRDEPLSLSFAQRRMWVLNQLVEDQSAYLIPTALRLTGTLHVMALEQALNEIIRRHETLRTHFETVESQPVQIIAPALTLALSPLDLSAWAQTEREAEVRRLAEEMAREPFDLAVGPLLRVTLLRLGAEEHVLLLVMHHIVSDGWSMGILVKELTALYKAFLSGQPSPLAELPIQYADFARWQLDWLSGEVLEAQLAYWRRHLAGAPPMLELATDSPRPAVQTYRGAHQVVQFSPALTQALRQLSRREEVTLFMTLLAAFKTLFHKYTGQDEIVVGTPIANRNRAEMEGLIGFFVNTLALRTDLSGSPSFSELLVRVRETALGAYTHQDLPFEKLVEEFQPERDLSRNPIFQTMFVLQNTPLPSLELAGLKLELLPLDNGTTLFDMTLSLWDTEEILTGFLAYNTDLFEAETIERMMERFENLLEQIVSRPELPLSELSLLSKDEERLLLVEWNETRRDYPQDQCIHELFEAQAELTPEAVAVSSADEQLTYRELNQRANQLAHYLRDLGVGPETLVGVCLGRSVELPVAILGILKAGGAYLPLDPLYPKERLSFMIQDSAVAMLLTLEQLMFTLPEHEAPVVELDSSWAAIARESRETPAGVVTPDNLAYVIYTSGSTGQPKGALIAHRGLSNLSEAQVRHFDLQSSNRVFQFSSLSFDASIFEIVMALRVGATLYLEKLENLLPGPGLIGALRDHAITHVTLPPSVLASLPDADLPELQTIIVAGEACSPELVKRWAGGRRFFNAYGPTETTIWATIAECRDSQRTPPIGVPIENTQVYLLDSHLHVVPIGVAGELYIGGIGLARGYLGRPDLTATKFIPHPFSREPGSRLYKTGDRARYRADGNLEFLGRLDQQVKIRGFRIELGEIEAVLSQRLDVREVIVVARGEHSAEKRLVAYIVPDGDAAPSMSDLRGYLKEKLPSFMVPSAFVMMESLPLTPNGKIDHRALPAPDRNRTLEEAYVAPRTEIEELLAGIWGDVLELERIGIHDNFFEIGGHSLLATQVASRVRETFEIELPLRNIFEAPTVAELAAVIEPMRDADRKLLAPAIQSVSRELPLPLSFAQQRLWFIDQFEGPSPAYNMSFAVRHVGNLNVAALQQSLNEIVQRHEVLRTTFATTDGEPYQVINSGVNLSTPVTDLRYLPLETRMDEVQRLAGERLLLPFDLSHDLMLRANLYRVAEDEHVLLLIIHHIASDGWSIGILIRELTELYAAFTQDQPSPLGPLAIHYADYASWQQQWLSGEVLESQLAYWKKQLAGAPHVLELPTDRPRPAIQTFRGAKHTVIIPKTLSEKVKALSQREGTTLFMTLLAGFKALLCRYSGQTDIVVGTPIAGRTHQETEGLIGFFINTLVLRTDLSHDPTVKSLLGRVRETALGAYAYQDLPFEKLVEELQPERNMSHTPVFQVMFGLQNAPLPALEMPGMSLTPLNIESGRALFDITLSLMDSTEDLTGSIEYNTDLFDAATIKRLEQQYKTLLEAMAADPEQKLSELALLTEAEREEILVRWNDTRGSYPADQSLPELIEAQAARTPAALAAASDDEQLTYGELNQRSNQLAHYLRRCGVGPEVPVAICLERSTQMIVAMLAVLKAGGAYLPFDSETPTERLDFMLKDTATSLIITQSSLAGILPPSEARVICLDVEHEDIARESTSNPPSQTTSESLAYLIYTSGSTGLPNGVGISHRALLNLVFWHNRSFAVSERDRATQIAGTAFDAAVWEIWPYLVAGASLHLPSTEARRVPEQLRDWMLARQITISFLPTPLAEHVLTLEWPAESSLRTLLTGGDQLHNFELAGLPFDLVNNYGPTENCVVTTSGSVKGMVAAGVLPPIGRPISNTKVYLLDAKLQPVPVGVPGELYVAGAGLARGYHNRAALTAQKFIPNPFAATPGARLYMTGDCARYRADGQIEFLGRSDYQVKVRGFRIELGEIETLLNQHEAVREAVVVAREDGCGGKQLAAYVVPDNEPQPTASELRRFLQQQLPDYMLPSVFVMLDILPLTINGKVDRRALPVPEQERAIMSPHLLVAPSDEIESQLVEIWEEILGFRPIGVRDNFFELGGHSLMSVRLLARVEQRFGRKLPLASLFQGPTVEQLARLLRDEQTPAKASVLVPIQTGGSRHPLFLVHSATGTAFSYTALARYLGTEQPVYGFQSAGLEGAQDGPREVSTMAASYIKEMRAVQPAGPYLLGGWSMGGLVAYEMAQQLQAQGEEVSLLSLFDSFVPAPENKTELDDLSVLVNFAHDLGVPLDQIEKWIETSKELEADHQLGAMLDHAKAANVVPSELDLAHLHRLLDVFKINVRAMQSYVLQPYAGRIVLFRAEEQLMKARRQGRLARFMRRVPLLGNRVQYAQGTDEKTLGWGRLAAAGVEVQNVPGNHYTIFREPHIKALAAELNARLADVLQNDEGASTPPPSSVLHQSPDHHIQGG